uniref:Uncharacterized protein n=1 Tax=Knipowitschia caucasica TaxID=637954 RepID=A0AAV2M7E0_KNICA
MTFSAPLFPTAAQKAEIALMTTARTDTMNAAALLIVNDTTMRTITVTALCLLLQALEPRDVTSTEMTEDDALTGHITIDEADLLIPHSQDNLLHNGAEDRLLNLLIPLKDLPCHLDDAHGLGHIADLRVQIL